MAWKISTIYLICSRLTLCCLSLICKCSFQQNMDRRHLTTVKMHWKWSNLKYGPTFEFFFYVTLSILGISFTGMAFLFTGQFDLAKFFQLLQTRRFYKFHFTINFFLLILKTCLQKENCLYIYREKEYKRKKIN